MTCPLCQAEIEIEIGLPDPIDLTLALLIHLAHGQTTIRRLLEEIVSEQSQIDADVNSLGDSFTSLSATLQSEVSALQAAQAAGQPLDLTNLDAIAGNFSTLATSAASALSSATATSSSGTSTPTGTGTGTGTTTGTAPAGSGSTSTPTTAPTGSTPAGAPAGTVAQDPGNSLPLYTYTGTGAPDPSGGWTQATDVQGANGEVLYTYSGDSAGTTATGASANWTPYTGTPTPIASSSTTSTAAGSGTASTTPAGASSATTGQRNGSPAPGQA